MGKLKAVPLELKQANSFVDELHRHHDPVFRDKFRVGTMLNGKLVGVVQIGRPVSRMLDDGRTVEVTWLCSDGTENVCSFLYGRAAKIAREMGVQQNYHLHFTDRAGNVAESRWVDAGSRKMRGRELGQAQPQTGYYGP